MSKMLQGNFVASEQSIGSTSGKDEECVRMQNGG